VQDALEPALGEIAGAAISVTCAGRTDRGVHARNQVVHFDTDADRPPSAWVRGVNAHLPDAVAVLWAHAVDDEFHARYSALSRTYLYRLLELAPMREAARHFVGEHDFSAFRSAECQAKSPVRTIFELEIARERETITFVIRANAFLHHMVRNIIGSLLYVGKGKHAPRWIGEVLASKDRSKAAPTFGPEGLYLEAIEYAPKWGLPQ